MLSLLRLAGVAIIALVAGITVAPKSSGSSIDIAGEYAWTMLDHDEYASILRRRGTGDAVAGSLVLTRTRTGFDARMTSDMLVAAQPFLVAVVDDRVIVYADTELGELRLDVPAKPGVPAEWTIRSEEWGELHGRLQVTRR